MFICSSRRRLPRCALVTGVQTCVFRSLVIESHSLRSTAVNLLDTYVGRQAGSRILDGEIRRRAARTIYAAIRTAESRVGKECVSACSTRWWPEPSTKTKTSKVNSAQRHYSTSIPNSTTVERQAE